MKGTRKSSPGTYRMESSAPKVLSRYLRGSTGSCHDYCKCGILTQTTEPKPINRFLKRAPKVPVDRRIAEATHSVNKIRKTPSVVPKAAPRITNIKNNKVVKDEGLKRDRFKFPTKKDVAIEPKSRDLKPKSQISRTSRRHSDVFQPNEDMVIPLKVPKRRLSDVGSVSNGSLVRGSSIKNESRKNLKPISVNKKSNSSPKVPSPKPGANVLPPMRSYRSLPKPELKGSRKLKPMKTVGEVEPQKRRNVVDRTKSQIPISSTCSSSTSEDQKAVTCSVLQESCPLLIEDNKPSIPDGEYNDKITDDSEDKNVKEETTESQIPISSASSSGFEEEVIACNLQQECSTSMEDNIPATDGQNDDNIEDSEDKTAKEVGKLMMETSESQVPISSASSSSELELQESCSQLMEDNTPAKDGQNDDNIEDSEDETAKEAEKLVVETTESQIPISPASSSSSSEDKSCPPSMEDDTPATDGQNDDNITDSEDKIAKEGEKSVVETTESQIPISPASSSSSSEEKSCRPSMEDDTPATDVQDDDNLEDSEDKDTKETNKVGKLVVETEDRSPGEHKFIRGTILSPESEDSSPRKVQFKQGKELEENESEKDEIMKSLRRLSSDGVVITSPESQSVKVDLKHQEMVEKKDTGLFNSLIEETASKLIRTRKSKVKALVSAFENITSGNNQTP